MFAKKLRELRKSRNITQLALAKELGLSQQTVARWETGAATPPLETISRVSEFFGVPFSYFLEESDVQQSPKIENVELEIFKDKITTFQNLSAVLSDEQEASAYKALNGALSILPSCFLENKGDGTFVVDTESFLLYMTTIEKVALFSFWIETKAKELHAIKSSKEAYNSIAAAIPIPFNEDMKKEFEQTHAFSLVFEQLDMLFDELKKDWANNARRLFEEFLQKDSNSKDN